LLQINRAPVLRDVFLAYSILGIHVVSIKNLLPTTHLRQKIVVCAMLALLSVYASEAHARRIVLPSPATEADQAAYLAEASKMRARDYDYGGGRNPMPAYGAVLSLAYADGLTKDEFLNRAQIFNVNMSIVLLLGLFVLLRNFFDNLYSVALLLPTAFAVFLHLAVFAQAEVMYYFIFFCSFLLFLKMLVKPTWFVAIGAGLLAGLAYLTKAAALPALAIFSIVYAASIFLKARGEHQTAKPTGMRRIALLTLLLASFFAAIFPYIQANKKIYGAYFYNVNSSFYAWCDSWPEAEALTKAHRDRTGWPQMPPEQIPSPGKYWREHTVAHIAGRLFGGTARVLTHGFGLIGYYKYVAIFSVTAAVLILRDRSHFLEVVRPLVFPAIFSAALFGIYLLMFGWWEPISNASRYPLSLFLPAMFVTSQVIVRLGKTGHIALGGKRRAFLTVFAIAIVCLSLFDVVVEGARLSYAEAQARRLRENRVVFLTAGRYSDWGRPIDSNPRLVTIPLL
jgi:hypothetical protein